MKIDNDIKVESNNKEDFDDFIEKVLPIIIRIKKEHKGKDWTGKEPCPVCGNDLFLSHCSFNSHVWGKCKTVHCLNWAE